MSPTRWTLCILPTAVLVHLWTGLRAWSGSKDVTEFILLGFVLFVLYGVALRFLWPRSHSASTSSDPKAALWILGAALLFRLLMLPAGSTSPWPQFLAEDLRGELPFDTFLLYDNDVWRYLWDGRLTSAGLAVYQISPADVESAADRGEEWAEDLVEPDPWEEIHSRVSYRDYRTVYPPGAQALFHAVSRWTPGSVIAWKTLMVAFDMGTCLLLILWLRRRGRPPNGAILYAWNPLVIKELSGSAHVDAALIFFLCAAFYYLELKRPWRTWLFFSAALLVKPTPIWLLPLFMRRTRWTTWWLPPVVGGLAFLPFLGSVGHYFQSLGRFAQDWAFNAGPWNLFLRVSRACGFERAPADALSLLLTLMVVIIVTLRDDGSRENAIRGAIWILGAYLVLSPTVMPWYLLWVLPWIVLHPANMPRTWTWPVFTALSLLSYGIYVDGQESPLVLTIEYSLWALVASWEWIRNPSKP